MFIRPVPEGYPILRHYGEAGPHFKKYIDPKTKLWMPGRLCANCKKEDPCGCPNPDPNGNHRGVDFSCPDGTPIIAMCDGMVVRTGPDRDSSQHESGVVLAYIVYAMGFDAWHVTYLHVGGVCVNLAQKLKAGDRIAYSHYTGPGAPYLHVELQCRNKLWTPPPIEPEMCDQGCAACGFYKQCPV